MFGYCNMRNSTVPQDGGIAGVDPHASYVPAIGEIDSPILSPIVHAGKSKKT
jgi:hypothetical protein